MHGNVTIKKPKGPAHFVAIIKSKIQQSPTRWRTYVEDLHGRDIATIQGNGFGWPMKRSLKDHYNPIFAPALAQFFKSPSRIGLVEILLRNLPRKKSSTLEILEDGAGEGIGLAKIVEQTKASGIKVNATALTMAKNSVLEERARASGFKVVTGPAELFVPKKKMDLIISLFGSIYFNATNFRGIYLAKDNLEKFAYSLKPNGVLMVAFKAKFANGQSTEMNPEKTERFLQNLIKSFKKRNFRAEVFPFTNVEVEGPKPTHVLIIQRLPNLQRTK
ncbi:MAG: class I SAM-dependent methyltransferase [archaeon]